MKSIKEKSLVVIIKTKIQQKAFEKLKTAIINATTLGIYKPNKLLYVQTDACNLGVGGCLLQDDIPITYL